MNQQATKLRANASTAVVFPIVGMLGGLIVGSMRASGMADQIAQLMRVIKWGVAGFFAGLAFVVLLSFASGSQDIVSVRKLMALVVVAGLLAWFFSRILFNAIGYEGF